LTSPPSANGRRLPCARPIPAPAHPPRPTSAMPRPTSAMPRGLAAALAAASVAMAAQAKWTTPTTENKQFTYAMHFTLPGVTKFAAFVGSSLVVQSRYSPNAVHAYNYANPTQALSETLLPGEDNTIWSMSANGSLSGNSPSFGALHWWSPTAPHPPTQIATSEKNTWFSVEAAIGSHALIIKGAPLHGKVEFHIVDFAKNGSVLRRTIVRGSSLQCTSANDSRNKRRLSHDGETVFLLCPKDGALYFWSRHIKRIVRKVALPRPQGQGEDDSYGHYDMACSRDGKKAFIVGSNGDLWELNLMLDRNHHRALRPRGESGRAPTKSTPTVQVSDDGRYVLTLIERELDWDGEISDVFAIQVWKLGQSDPVFETSLPYAQPGKPPAAISGDGSFFLAGTAVWKRTVA